MVEWAKKNIFRWTALVAIAVFLAGPFIQKYATDKLERVFPSEDVLIRACSPLRSVSLVLTSRSENDRKIHGAMPFNMLQKMHVIVQNNSGKPIENASVYIAPLNNNGNDIFSANYYTNNRLTPDELAVEERDYNDNKIELGTFYQDQVLVMEYVGVFPTGFFVQFGSPSESSEAFFASGDCDLRRAPTSIPHPVDFFQKEYSSQNDNTNSSEEPQQLGPVEDPIGPTGFEVFLDYDCGSGKETQFVELGGPVSYCNIRLNQ